MHADKPAISVIMSVYNIASLDIFPQAIRSILTQTFQDFELILCDDGSTDGTWKYLERFARQDSRIKLIQNRRNEGLAAALNHCIEFAQGSYIARQDADDLSIPDRFSKQLAFLGQHPEVSFVGSNTDLFDPNGIWRSRRFPASPTSKDFLFTLPFIHGSLMFRGDVLRNNLYKVSRETRRAEDYELLMRLYAQGIQGANLQEVLYLFQEGPETRKRRKFCYRIDEMKVRWQGFGDLGLMPGALPYVVKPLIVGMIPQDLLVRLKQKKRF